jgi:predicted DNA-binding transcriptional regulator YafY
MKLERQQTKTRRVLLMIDTLAQCRTPITLAALAGLMANRLIAVHERTLRRDLELLASLSMVTITATHNHASLYQLNLARSSRTVGFGEGVQA